MILVMSDGTTKGTKVWAGAEDISPYVSRIVWDLTAKDGKACLSLEVSATVKFAANPGEARLQIDDKGLRLFNKDGRVVFPVDENGCYTEANGECVSAGPCPHNPKTGVYCQWCLTDLGKSKIYKSVEELGRHTLDEHTGYSIWHKKAGTTQ